jgi:hypothetical protein
MLSTVVERTTIKSNGAITVEVLCMAKSSCIMEAVGCGV